MTAVAVSIPDNVLIVEGPSDAEFLTGLASSLGKSVKIHPPKVRGQLGNGINNVLVTLPIDLKLAATGAIRHLGTVIDADHDGVNGGFGARRAEILSILESHNYDVSTAPPTAPLTGEIFQHKGGLQPFGLWIMPDHQGDGSLEDFLCRAITDTAQQQAFAYGVASLNARPANIQFYHAVCHKSKAELATWLALQKPPGMPAQIALKNALLDTNVPSFVAFLSWLNKVFP